MSKPKTTSILIAFGQDRNGFWQSCCASTPEGGVEFLAGEYGIFEPHLIEAVVPACTVPKPLRVDFTGGQE